MNIFKWFRKLFQRQSRIGLPPIWPSCSSSFKINCKSEQSISKKRGRSLPIIDERSAKNIEGLNLALQPLAEQHVLELQRLGLNFKITSGLRDYAEQRRLYAKGRTAPGDKVTNARAGFSWHNFGLAYDLTLFSGKNPVWNSRHYETAGKIGKALGLEWGGDWKKIIDRPHFQLPMQITLAQARKRRANDLPLV